MQKTNLCLASTATLLACKSIAQAFAENIFELAHLRRDWTIEYAESLRNRLSAILEEHLAAGQNQDMAGKVNNWRELMISALTDLAIVRASVKVDFGGDKDFLKEFFNATGYTLYFSDAKNGDHECMYHFIQAFADNLTPEWTEKITSKGLSPAIIKRLKENAASLDKFRECFEVVTNSNIADDGGLTIFEQLYSEIRDICRIATAYYYFDPLKRESFNFFKALRNIHH